MNSDIYKNSSFRLNHDLSDELSDDQSPPRYRTIRYDFRESSDSADFDYRAKKSFSPPQSTSHYRASIIDDALSIATPRRLRSSSPHHHRHYLRISPESQISTNGGPTTATTTTNTGLVGKPRRTNDNVVESLLSSSSLSSLLSSSSSLLPPPAPPAPLSSRQISPLSASSLTSSSASSSTTTTQQSKSAAPSHHSTQSSSAIRRVPVYRSVSTTPTTEYEKRRQQQQSPPPPPSTSLLQQLQQQQSAQHRPRSPGNGITSGLSTGLYGSSATAAAIRQSLSSLDRFDDHFGSIDLAGLRSLAAATTRLNQAAAAAAAAATATASGSSSNNNNNNNRYSKLLDRFSIGTNSSTSGYDTSNNNSSSSLSFLQQQPQFPFRSRAATSSSSSPPPPQHNFDQSRSSTIIGNNNLNKSSKTTDDNDTNNRATTLLRRVPSFHSFPTRGNNQNNNNNNNNNNLSLNTSTNSNNLRNNQSTDLGDEKKIAQNIETSQINQNTPVEAKNDAGKRDNETFGQQKLTRSPSIGAANRNRGNVKNRYSYCEKNIKDEVIRNLDRLEKRVAFLREVATELRDEKAKLIDALQQIDQCCTINTFTEVDLQDIRATNECLQHRLAAVEITIRTMRSPSQQEALRLATDYLDKLATETMAPPAAAKMAAKQRCLSYISSCSSDGCSLDDDRLDASTMSEMIDRVPIDERFQRIVIQCSLDDQKAIRKRLQSILLNVSSK